MNLFWLAKLAKESVKLQNDNHVIKMPLEATQSAYTALRLAGVLLDDGAYKATHDHHPLIRWAACHRNHLRATAAFGVVELFGEYHARNPGKRHKTVRDGHVDRLERLADTSPLPNSLPDSAESPSERVVVAWDAAFRAAIQAKRDDPADPANYTAAGRKRKRKPLEPMVLATVDLPDGLSTIPLCMPAKYHVRDADGALCGIASHRNFYFHAKLNGTSPMTNMYTYHGKREWPEPFASMSASVDL